MDKELTREARIQLTSSLRRRYGDASSKAKKRILSEFVAVTGYHPKYVIHMLNAETLTSRVSRKRIRPSIYDDARKQALIVL